MKTTLPKNFFYFNSPLWKKILWAIRDAFDDLRVALGGWRRELIWCPSQIRKQLITPKGQLELYMRWRWENPWTGIFIFKVDGNEYWTENLFENYYFCDEDFHSGERELLRIYHLWVAGKYILPFHRKGYFLKLNKDTPDDKILPPEYFQNAPIAGNYRYGLFDESGLFDE